MLTVIAVRKRYPKRLPAIKLIYQNGQIIACKGPVPEFIAKHLPYKIASDGGAVLQIEPSNEDVSGDMFCCHLVCIPDKKVIIELDEFYKRLINELELL